LPGSNALKFEPFSTVRNVEFAGQAADRSSQGQFIFLQYFVQEAKKAFRPMSESFFSRERGKV
jgi:hypothetical protein